MKNPPSFSTSELEIALRAGDRVALSRCITLAESDRASDQKKTATLLSRIHSHTGRSIRIGISGVPGAGKSTWINVFGSMLTRQGLKVAVLTIDPSSEKTRGSILGDKTRMDDLARDPLAFIRPSPSRSILGGVTSHTREAILLCEAAGYEVILVETVGVGQSETAVRHMVDFFLLMLIGGAGDELQGIKKGIIEMADGILVNKADGASLGAATRARAELLQALHLYEQSSGEWKTRVLLTSAAEKKGLEESWQMILDFKDTTTSSGQWATQRSSQQLRWMEEYFNHQVQHSLQSNAAVRKQLKALGSNVENGQLNPVAAANTLFKIWSKTGRQK